jgi:hypothetical protein
VRSLLNELPQLHSPNYLIAKQPYVAEQANKTRRYCTL